MQQWPIRFYSSAKNEYRKICSVLHPIPILKLENLLWAIFFTSRAVPAIFKKGNLFIWRVFLVLPDYIRIPIRPKPVLLLVLHHFPFHLKCIATFFKTSLSYGKLVLIIDWYAICIHTNYLLNIHSTDSSKNIILCNFFGKNFHIRVKVWITQTV